MSGEGRHYFEFGDFRIDVEERRLLRGSIPVALASRDFDVLLALVTQAGETIDKSDLLETVWPDTFVEEGNLNRHVSTLRRLLGDDPREQRLIKTIPKRGYRFTADVRETVESSETVATESVASTRIVIRKEVQTGFWRWPRVALVCLVAVAAVGGWFGMSGVLADNAKVDRDESFELVARGRRLWSTRNADDLHNATAMLERAVKLSPDFAPAHAALADAYAFDYANWPRAEAEAREAIRLDPTMGEPYASIGFVRMFWEWRVAESEEEFKQAISLSPNYATGRQWYAINLIAQGRGDASLVEIERASVLEPASVPIGIDRCRILYFVDNYDEAEKACRKVLISAPGSIETHELLFQIALTQQRYDLAAEQFALMSASSKSDRIREEGRRVADAFTTGGAAMFQRALVKFYSTDDTSFYKLARIKCEIGDTESAVSNLREAAVARDFDLVYYEGDPAFRTIRGGATRHVIDGRPE